MQLGQKILCTPVTLNDPLCKSLRSMRGRIVYIHPKGRYVTVAFRTSSGVELRESFAPMDVRPVK